MAWLTAAFQIVASLLGFKKAADDNKAGQDAQKVADMQGDIDVIHRANVAAKKQEGNPDAYDSNDLDARR